MAEHPLTDQEIIDAFFADYDRRVARGWSPPVPRTELQAAAEFNPRLFVQVIADFFAEHESNV